MLTQPSSLASTSDLSAEIERLANTPDNQAEHITQSIRVMCTDMAVPESAMTTLRAVKNARSLVSAVKTVWYASPTSLRPSLQANLLDLIARVEDLHGSASIESLKLAAPQTLDPLIEAAATRPGLTWSSAAAALLAARPPVVPPQATDHLLAVRDPVSFRIAISVAVQNATCPPVLDQLITETRAALQPAAGPAAAYAWLERRASYPPPRRNPPTAQHQLPNTSPTSRPPQRRPSRTRPSPSPRVLQPQASCPPPS